MKKKIYIHPETTVTEIKSDGLMQHFSSAGVNDGTTFTISDDDDGITIDSKRNTAGSWDSWDY